MPGPPPKPDSQRVRRNRATFEWVTLPAEGRKGRAPKLPPIRDWSPATLRWWRDLWRSPQATQWDQTGRTLAPMAVLYQAMLDHPEKANAFLAEMRHHEDRHGLNPKAMLSLRWRIGEPEAPPPAPAPSRRRAHLVALVDHRPEGGPDAS